MEKERDEDKEEAQLAQLATVAVGDTKALVEEKLARAQDALKVVEEARWKVENEATRLKVE